MSRRPAVLLAPLALALLPGCLERKLEVKTTPPDATVTVDGRELKRADKDGPAVLEFEHYGTRRIVVRREGYRAQDRLVTLDPPWYQIFPIDLVTDVVIPWTIDDTREETFTLDKRQDIDASSARALIERARETGVEADKPAEKKP